MTSTTLDLAVTVTNVGPDAFHVTRVGTGFASPLYLTAVPDGSGRVFVVERAGRIRILTPSTGAIAATPFLDVTAQTTTDGERGLLGFAPAPNFTTTGTFYVYMTNTGRPDRDQALPDPEPAIAIVADPATADAILTIDHPVNTNHYGGWLAFGPDGLLYMGIGDGGGAGDVPNNAQNLNILLGKILRIDPSTDAFPADPARDYAIPPGNPFAASGGAAGNLGLWRAQSLPRQFRRRDRQSVDRRRRPGRARGDRPAALDRRRRQSRLAHHGGHGNFLRADHSGPHAAGRRISARQRRAAGQYV